MNYRLNFVMALSSLLALIFGCRPAPQPPEWSRAQMLLDKLDHPSALTTDDQYLYYVTGGTLASLQEGTSGVWQVPLAGGTPVQLFKGYQKDEHTVFLPDTFVLATDDKYLYWASGSIWRTPKAGGDSESIIGGTPTELVLDGAKIYWHDYVGEGMKPLPVYAVGKQGGAVQTLTDAVNISSIAVDKEFLYWSQPDGVYRTPKNGGAKTRLYAPPGKEQITGMIADQDSFYLMQGDGPSALVKVAKQGGAVSSLAPRINNAHRFYADNTDIYFVLNEGTFGTSLNKVSKNGGPVTKLDSGYLRSFTVGKDKIYVSDIARIYALSK